MGGKYQTDGTKHLWQAKNLNDDQAQTDCKNQIRFLSE
jgi:hypothetical protein